MCLREAAASLSPDLIWQGKSLFWSEKRLLLRFYCSERPSPDGCVRILSWPQLTPTALGMYDPTFLGMFRSQIRYKTLQRLLKGRQMVSRNSFSTISSLSAVPVCFARSILTVYDVRIAIGGCFVLMMSKTCFHVFHPSLLLWSTDCEILTRCYGKLWDYRIKMEIWF